MKSIDLAMRLLKSELHPGENQYKHQYKMPSHEDVHPEWYSWIQELDDDPAEYEGIADDFTQPDMNHLAGAKSREDFFERLNNLHNFQVDDARPPFDDIEGKYRDFTDIPFSEETGFTRSEPMDLAYDAIRKNLNRWFKEKWVDVSRKDKDGKHPPCGRSKAKKSSKGYPKCRPSVKVSGKTPKTSGSMSEGQKQAATKRKRSKKQGVGGKPTIVKMVRVV